MKKVVIIIFLIPFILSGCKDIYSPEINNINNALVVQGMITDNPGEAYVKLSKAVSYDSTDNRVPVDGAVVTVTDDQGKSYNFTNTGSGNYLNSQAFGVIGHAYTLNISTPEGNNYISSAQIMPVRFKQDSIYAAYATKDVLIPDASSSYLKTTLSGLETWVDLSSDGNEIPKCRFEETVVVLYTYTGQGFPPPTIFCWKTFNPNRNLNLTENKFDKVKSVIIGHSINFFSTELYLYDEREGLSRNGWLLTVHKFNLNQETYKYYQDVNNQLSSSGKIFDPLPAQLVGNIHCTNNSKNLVMGFFEASSSETYYYKYIFFKGVHLSPRTGFPGLTPQGERGGLPPEFWY